MFLLCICIRYHGLSYWFFKDVFSRGYLCPLPVFLESEWIKQINKTTVLKLRLAKFMNIEWTA